MSDIGRLESEREITRLLMRYCHLLDSREVSRIAPEVFTADGIADYQGRILRGRREIGDYLEANVPGYKETAHLLSNVWVLSLDGDRAEVTSNLTAWHWWDEADKQGPERVTNFVQVVKNTDRLERTREGWRISERRTQGIGSLCALGDDARLPAGLLPEPSGAP